MRSGTTATVAARGCGASGAASPRATARPGPVSQGAAASSPDCSWSGARNSADLDLASHGVVKVYEDRGGTRYPGLPWEPKAAFDAVAEYHRAR
ncbi:MULTISPECIES: hypothetical protein [unclassified Streptomyces]|uniref:hypothetical protein n=1 Tax=unclassified Streptomyces TaxID=2593676 RepID=UPI0036F78F3B